MTSIDTQIYNALCEAEKALANHERLKGLNLRSAEIKSGVGKKGLVLSEETRRKLLSLVMIRI